MPRDNHDVVPQRLVARGQRGPLAHEGLRHCAGDVPRHRARLRGAFAGGHKGNIGAVGSEVAPSDGQRRQIRGAVEGSGRKVQAAPRHRSDTHYRTQDDGAEGVRQAHEATGHRLGLGAHLPRLLPNDALVLGGRGLGLGMRRPLEADSEGGRQVWMEDRLRAQRPVETDLYRCQPPAKRLRNGYHNIDGLRSRNRSPFLLRQYYGYVARGDVQNRRRMPRTRTTHGDVQSRGREIEGVKGGVARAEERGLQRCEKCHGMRRGAGGEQRVGGAQQQRGHRAVLHPRHSGRQELCAEPRSLFPRATRAEGKALHHQRGLVQ